MSALTSLLSKCTHSAFILAENCRETFLMINYKSDYTFGKIFGTLHFQMQDPNSQCSFTRVDQHLMHSHLSNSSDLHKSHKWAISETKQQISTEGDTFASEWMWVYGTSVMGVGGASHLQMGLVKVNEISWFQKGSFSEMESGPIRVRMLWLSDRSLTWLVFAPIAPGNHQRLPQSLIISRAKPGGSWEKYVFISLINEARFSVT